jgi:hypothetical protein
MKKTLIALAVLAASGASFAQVTITGNLTMGYQASSTSVASTAAAGTNAADSSGFGVDTSQIDFAATEVLGNGYKATAKMSLAGADRSGESNSADAGGVTGRDASLTVETPMGAFVLGSGKSGDYLTGLAGQNQYYSGWDEKITGARSRRDTVSYMVPVATGLLLSLSYQEAGNNQGLGNGTSGTNSTVAATAPAVTNNVGQTLQVIGLNYKVAALVIDGQFLNNLSSAATTGTALGKTQVRLAGTYDLGVVKLGAGHVVTTFDNGQGIAQPKQYDTLVSAAVPLGSLTLGANFITRRSDDLAANQLAGTITNGTQNGWSVQATYALSKRTSMIANYARWDGSVGNTTQANRTQMLLSHSF